MHMTKKKKKHMKIQILKTNGSNSKDQLEFEAIFNQLAILMTSNGI